MNRSKSISRDEVLINEYGRVPDKSSEAIIREVNLSANLLAQVNERLPKEDRFKLEELKQRLENLRKRGILPKKFRQFNGRILSKEKPR